jgi:hypothetical protein
MRKILLAACLFATIVSIAQDYTVPVNYSLVSKEDYTKYEKDVIDAAKWLVNTPLDEQKHKRQQVSAFIFKWINGSPTVSVELNTNIMDLDEKNPGMLIIFMASCAKYVLENNYSKDMRAKHRYAMIELITVYKSGKGIRKDKKMDRLIKHYEDGKLDQWLEDNLKVNAH